MSHSEHTPAQIESLVAEAGKGQERAFRALYEVFGKSMYNLCLRMLNDRDKAGEALQDGFLKAFQQLHQLSEPSAFGAWLRKILVNRCLDELRRKKIRWLPVEDLAEMQEEESEELEGIDAAQILDAIASLPDGYRVVLSLHLFENYSHADIAEKLGISEGTSKSQYARARKKVMLLLQTQKT